MEHLKEWALKHKALAAGVAIAVVVLLYLWLRGGSSAAPAGSSSDAALSAYYGAEASSLQGAASQTASEDQLQATIAQINAAAGVQTGQTTASQAIAQGQIDAQNTQTTASLQALEDELNLTAYQDYLAEQSGAGQGSTSTPYSYGTLNSGDAAILDLSGGQSSIWDLVTGQHYYNSEVSNPNFPVGSPNIAPPGVTGAMEFGASSALTPVNWAPGGTPTPFVPHPISAPVLQFGDFHGIGPSPITTQPITQTNA